MKNQNHISNDKIVTIHFINWLDDDTTEDFFLTGRVIEVKTLMLNAFIIQFCSYHNGMLTIDNLRFKLLCDFLRVEDITNEVKIVRK